jgi:hypothetical protein
LYNQRNLKNILKTSLVILISAETACILTAETVDLIFYKYFILLSVPLALLAGAFTVVAPQAYKIAKTMEIFHLIMMALLMISSYHFQELKTKPIIKDKINSKFNYSFIS